jgi:hypothetical protein
MSTEELPQSLDPTVTTPMADTKPQTAGGNVLWHSTTSLDGFVAGRTRDGLDDWDLVPSQPCRGVRRNDRRCAGRSRWL